MHTPTEHVPIGGDWDEYLDEFLALADEETIDLQRAVVPSETAATLDQGQHGDHEPSLGTSRP